MAPEVKHTLNSLPWGLSVELSLVHEKTVTKASIIRRISHHIKYAVDCAHILFAAELISQGIFVSVGL